MIKYIVCIIFCGLVLVGCNRAMVDSSVNEKVAESTGQKQDPVFVTHLDEALQAIDMLEELGLE